MDATDAALIAVVPVVVVLAVLLWGRDALPPLHLGLAALVVGLWGAQRR